MTSDARWGGGGLPLVAPRRRATASSPAASQGLVLPPAEVCAGAARCHLVLDSAGHSLPDLPHHHCRACCWWQARKLESELDIKIAAYGKLCSNYEYGYSKGESGMATDQASRGLCNRAGRCRR